MMRKSEQAVITPAKIIVSFDLFRLIAPAEYTRLPHPSEEDAN